MISLTILMAVIRDIIEDDGYKETLQRCIYQEENDATGDPESMRITLREREIDFFKTNVLEKNAL